MESKNNETTERKRLLNSQRELLIMKKANVDRQIALAQQLNQNLTDTVTSIALELGVPENEISQWQLNDEATFMEKIEAPKKEEAEEIIPGKKQ